MVLVPCLIASLTLSSIHADNGQITISSSCNDKDVDGLYYIKPLDDGPIIPVICNQQYTMLDLSLNMEQISPYFSSIYLYGNEGKPMYGTDCGDSEGWRGWYAPANDNTKFRVARDCGQCEPGLVFGDDTAYYMTSGYFCPVVVDSEGCTAHNPALVEDPMCNICDDTDGLCGTGGGRDGVENGNWCDCYTLQLSSGTKTSGIHSEYCEGGLAWRPNFVTDRSQCTCYQPAAEDHKVYTDISPEDLPTVSQDYKSDIVDKMGLYVDSLIRWDFTVETVPTADECRERRRYLTQADFDGTLRIINCGTYILTEDIVINFNKPSQEFDYSNGDSPNAYNQDNLNWFPTSEQQASGDYPGVDAFWGAFSLGYFAAITVETNHVYIDLGGHSIEMDYEFYLQQRFFAIIELANKQFAAKQGPVDFGRDDICITDIEVKNGILGRSSHHGIHGACVRHATIANLKIQNFDVGGIQCNGCNHVLFEHLDIGPQNTDIPVLGRYTHARSALSRMRYLVDEYGDETVAFANRGGERVTVRAVVDRMVEAMDMIYYHVIQGIDFDDNDRAWADAKQIFLNEDGWLDGGSAYGILLNGLGTAVVNIGRRTEGTSYITIRDVEIHDLKVQPREGFWASSQQRIVHGFFFETLDWSQNKIFDENTGTYIGDMYSDFLFAANTYLQTDFCPLGGLFFLDGLADWVFKDGATIFNPSSTLTWQCGSDVQSHSAKGAIGIRIDGTKHFELEDVFIHDMVNWGAMGSDACGEYKNVVFEVGVDVDPDIQYGYTGTKVTGILTDYVSGTMKNIRVENLESWHSTATAIGLYKGSHVRLDGHFQINQIIAGSKLTQSDVGDLKLPNPVPFTCTIQIGDNTQDDPTRTPLITYTDDFTVSSAKLYAYDFCGEARRVGDMDTPLSPEIAQQELLNAQWNIFTIANGKISSSFTLLACSMLIIMVLIVNWRCTKRQFSKPKLGAYQGAAYGSMDTNSM